MRRGDARRQADRDRPPVVPPVVLQRSRSSVDFINAQARVSINQVDSSVGRAAGRRSRHEPQVGARDVHQRGHGRGARRARTWRKTGTSNGLAVWDNAGAPLPVTLGTADVRSASSWPSAAAAPRPAASRSCPATTRARPTLASGLPTKGIVHLRGWSAAGNGAQPNDPILRERHARTGHLRGPVLLVRRLRLHVRSPARGRLRRRGDPLAAARPSSRPPSAARPCRSPTTPATGPGPSADDSVAGGRRRARERDAWIGWRRSAR